MRFGNAVTRFQDEHPWTVDAAGLVILFTEGYQGIKSTGLNLSPRGLKGLVGGQTANTGAEPVAAGSNVPIAGYVDGKAVPVIQGGGESVKGILKNAQLPTSGKIRFVPPENWSPSEPLPRGLGGKGYVDRFGNIWVKGPSRTPGQPFEWDVQLSRGATPGMQKLSPDGRHVNVSLDGEITH